MRSKRGVSSEAEVGASSPWGTPSPPVQGGSSTRDGNILESEGVHGEQTVASGVPPDAESRQLEGQGQEAKPHFCPL